MGVCPTITDIRHNFSYYTTYWRLTNIPLQQMVLNEDKYMQLKGFHLQGIFWKI